MLFQETLVSDGYKYSNMSDLITLSGTDIQVSRIGFGCDALGEFGWSGIDSTEIISSIEVALDSGINFFDTADIYGYGRSEKNLAIALKGKRDKAIISSKFGMRPQEGGGSYLDSSQDWIYQAVEESLNRLQTDYIDLYQLHWWDKKTNPEDIIDALEKLKEKGMIRAYGITNDYEGFFKLNTGSISSFSSQFSLIEASKYSEIKTYSASSTFLSWGSLAQGFLSGKYRKYEKFEDGDRRNSGNYKSFTDKFFKHNLEVLEILDKYSSSNTNHSALSIRWILDLLPNSIALVGIKNRKQLGDLINVLNSKIDETLFQELNTFANINYEDR